MRVHPGGIQPKEVSVRVLPLRSGRGARPARVRAIAVNKPAKTRAAEGTRRRVVHAFSTGIATVAIRPCGIGVKTARLKETNPPMPARGQRLER
jgi:hypothetical protein